MLRVLVFLCLIYSFTALADEPTFKINSGGAEIEVYLHEAPDSFDFQDLKGWIKHSADIVTDYYGKFPTPETRIDIDLFPGGGITGGTAYGIPGARIALTVGQFNTRDDLDRDWRLIHEMVHLALPRLDQEHHWLEEGLATYLETIIRVRAGDVSKQTAWKGFHRGLPHGLPDETESGLDGTRRWGRVYWGGALFALYADMMIRQETKGEISLQHGVRGILNNGLNHEQHKSLDIVLAIVDQSSKTSTFTDLYQLAGKKRWLPDLDELWNTLGVIVGNNQVHFDNSAVQALLREDLLSK